jgi:glutamyl-tRNA reductase
MKRVMKARKGRPVFLIDIAVPRDIDAAVGKLDGVYLFDIDDLEKVVAQNLEGRKAEAEAAERIVEAEAAQFLAWLRAQGVVPTIKELRERFAQIARAEAEKTVQTLANTAALSDKQEKLVRQMAESIINKLLHTPLMALKTPDDDEAEALVAATRRLFALPEQELAEAARTAALAADAAERAVARAVDDKAFAGEAEKNAKKGSGS